VVRDESMLPTLRPGDRLLLDPRAYRVRSPRVGEIVVVTDPEASDRWLVKRVAFVYAAEGTIDLRGDAADSARDSRQFGRVSTRAVVGRVYRLYFPPDRRREL
jgi:nickel-type superoxide dismutase maturation protease